MRLWCLGDGRRGHGEAENRRCRGKRACQSASACELQRRRREIVSESLMCSDAGAARHAESCKGEVARVGARDGDFSREKKQQQHTTDTARGTAKGLVIMQVWQGQHRDGFGD